MESWSDRMYCWNCGTKLPDHANYCEHCGSSRHGPSVGRAASETSKVVKQAVDQGVAALDKAIKAAEPHLRTAAKAASDAADELAKAARPAAERAAKSTRKAADATARRVKPAVARGAEAVEKGARRVKERAKKP
ncbi:MAG TPA: zinc ribbon domain-containing protein [Candidatus Thermoplasmatota archaeon]|nr:zinc ribbon domain-containing protein [Candidatus Thermoplasmatota archaeon]